MLCGVIGTLRRLPQRIDLLSLDHRSQNHHTHRERHNCRQELQLREALAQDVECLTGRHPRAEHIPLTEREDQAGTLKQRWAGQDCPDARHVHVPRVRQVPFPVEFEERVVLEQALLSLGGGRVTAHGAARVQHRAGDADDCVR